ncbi:MAG: hypothetical protein KIS76_04025 [Pyrinomonadaceae bacterium]|nr:hypothetical protein [Pyrinomonadaceae bacterium]
MHVNKLIEILSKHPGDTPVEVLSDCPNPECGFIYSKKVVGAFSSDRLNQDSTDLEPCLDLVTDDTQYQEVFSAQDRLTEIKRAFLEYDEARHIDERCLQKALISKISEILDKVDWIYLEKPAETRTK